MFLTASFFLLYLSFCAAFSAWGQTWGSLFLAFHAFFFWLTHHTASINRFLIMLQEISQVSIAIISSVAIGFVAWKKVDLELGIIFFIVTLLIHGIYLLGPE
ncbi:MAG: hypothetical protein KBC15_04075 [Candidatus Levybacteria bacterium]|nr:hypothetical protein [Candidatus Levybacteria bacterium]